LTDKAEEATVSVLTPRPTRRKARAGLFFREETMLVEPSEKRAIAFVDGQNLFRCAKTAFNYFLSFSETLRPRFYNHPKAK
jgi:hypothetical protein